MFREVEGIEGEKRWVLGEDDQESIAINEPCVHTLAASRAAAKASELSPRIFCFGETCAN